MNAPFHPDAMTIRQADWNDAPDLARIAAFVRDHDQGTVFHLPLWMQAVERGTGQNAHGLIAESCGDVVGWLPLTELHSPIFGRALASSGFGVGGGALALRDTVALRLCRASEEMARRLSCAAVELRGGVAPAEWRHRADSHCGFVTDLRDGSEDQLLAIPRKQRAEVRKGLEQDVCIQIGQDEGDRAAHYAVYAESVRNLGTPVFPRSLFDSVLDMFGQDADILTVIHQGAPVASVLSLYYKGVVLPYWGGGTWAARALRANDRMYFELMRHAHARGCTRFDFGRSKTGSGAWHFKKNWGFTPEPLSYAHWQAPGVPERDADPNRPRHAARIALWKRLPLGIAKRIGPFIARGLG